jgi:hypothetical protein
VPHFKLVNFVFSQLYAYALNEEAGETDTEQDSGGTHESSDVSTDGEIENLNASVEME